jgi:ADP-ribose pyrophosphatase YjhB (NUDIX family)
VAAYAVILRGEDILLSRLSPMVTTDEVWTLPGGGLDHGEDPRAAVVREVREETGLDVTVGETARVFSHHGRRTWRGRQVDAHALRIVYDGWVAADAPAPRTLEVGGTTSEAAWKPLAGVLDGSVPTVPLVREALAVHRVERVQRVSAYALIRRGGDVLLTRNSVHGPHPGQWSLPGGGIDFGESPREAVAREVREETGLVCQVGDLLASDDIALTGTAPSGRREEFHGIHLIFAATVPEDAEPSLTEPTGTTDAAAWIALADLDAGAVPIRDVVRTALAAGLPKLSP